MSLQDTLCFWVGDPGLKPWACDFVLSGPWEMGLSWVEACVLSFRDLLGCGGWVLRSFPVPVLHCGLSHYDLARLK